MAAWEGSRREVSMSDRVGVGALSGAVGGGGIDFDVAARASQAAFSSSSLPHVSILLVCIDYRIGVPFDFFLQFLQRGPVLLVLRIRFLHDWRKRNFFLYKY
jgi:hypothetical protein